jgi:hypothetical protein
MRGANPFIACLLANIAILKDGIYTATEAGKTYTWNDKDQATRQGHAANTQNSEPK